MFSWLKRVRLQIVEPVLDSTDPHVEYTILLCALARNFHDGSGTRPPLPVELVLDIFSLASITSPRPAAEIHPEKPIRVGSTGPETRQLWFSTPPLTARQIQRMTKIQLKTDSKDQGYSSDPDVCSHHHCLWCFC